MRQPVLRSMPGAHHQLLLALAMLYTLLSDHAVAGLRAIAIVQPLPSADMAALVRNATGHHAAAPHLGVSPKGVPPTPFVDVVVFPEGFVQGMDAAARCCAVAKETGAAVVCPSFGANGTSDVAVCAPTGDVILR